MKRALPFVALVLPVAAGALLAYRWFRGETVYEEAVRALDEQAPA